MLLDLQHVDDTSLTLSNPVLINLCKARGRGLGCCVGQAARVPAPPLRMLRRAMVPLPGREGWRRACRCAASCGANRLEPLPPLDLAPCCRSAR